MVPAAIAGATVVGVNPTRRGPELARDIAHTKGQFVVTTTADAALLADDVATLLVDQAGYGDELADYRTAGVPSALPGPAHPLLLLFTSGSTSAPTSGSETPSRAPPGCPRLPRTSSGGT